MNCGIDLGQWNSIFAVPVDVVDKHMKLAGAVQLKVLLYLLRHSGEEVTLEQLALAIGQKPADTQDAVEYWINCGLLASKGDIGLAPPKDAAEENIAPTATASSVTSTPSAAPPSLPGSTPSADIKNALGEGTAVRGKEKIRYRFDECMKFVSEDEDLKNMLTTVEVTLGKQLNHTDVACFVTLAKWYGLPCSVIPMLVQYCRSIGKNSINYIESTGIGWAGEEIDTLDKAEKKISGLTAGRKAWNTVRSILDIPERKATESEMKFSDLWINQLHIDTELIRIAYDKCINKNGKISFSYINGILKNYLENGINDVPSALKLDEQYRAEQELKYAARKNSMSVGKPSPKPSPKSDPVANGRYASTFDIDEIEAILDAEWMADNADIINKINSEN